MRARYLNDDEFVRILRALPSERRLIFEIARHTGLRIGDVVKIRKSDFADSSDGTLGVRYVAQKTGKLGIAVLDGELAARLRSAPRGRRGYIFSSERSRSGHITRQAAWQWFKAAAKAAGVSLDGCSPHALRKSYAVELRHERGIAAAQAALQHERESTTAIYAFADLYGGEADEPILWSQIDEVAELVAAKLKISSKKRC